MEAGSQATDEEMDGSRRDDGDEMTPRPRANAPAERRADGDDGWRQKKTATGVAAAVATCHCCRPQ